MVLDGWERFRFHQGNQYRDCSAASPVIRKFVCMNSSHRLAISNYVSEQLDQILALAPPRPRNSCTVGAQGYSKTPLFA